jgi:MFS family permease
MISDKYGRRGLHVVGTLLGVFPPLLYIFAKGWLDLIPWVILSGVATGLYLPIRWAIVADDSTAQTRAMAYSWISVAMFIGPTVAPLLGGILADMYGIQMPFLACFALTGLSFPLSMLLRETRRKNSPNDSTDAAKNEYNSSKFLSVALIFTSINVLQGINTGIFSPITPVFAKETFSLDLTFVGLLFAAGFGFASLIVQLPGAWLANRYDRKKLLVWTFALSSPFFSLFALSRNITELYVFMFLSSAIFNASLPAFQDLLMDLTPPAKWGLMQGISMTTFWIGMAIGSTLGGVLWDMFGKFIPYHVSALAMALSVIPTLFLNDPRHSTQG